MPIPPTFPGVYIGEIPRGARTITGVPTSITAFVGRTLRGPVNEPVRIDNFGDFERIFGGLSLTSPVSFAVRDFFINDGKQGIIVRLFNPFFRTEDERKTALDAARDVSSSASVAASQARATASNVVKAARKKANDLANSTEPRKTATHIVATWAERAATKPRATAVMVNWAAFEAIRIAVPVTKARLSVDTISLEAANEGDWGNKLRARVDHNLEAADLFSLSVKDGVTGQIENLTRISIKIDDPRFLGKVLENESDLVRLREPPSALPNQSPGPTDADPDPFSNANSSGVTAGGEASDGNDLITSDFEGSEVDKTGFNALLKADLFNLLCIPPYNSTDQKVDLSLWNEAATFCKKHRAMLLVDPPAEWRTPKQAIDRLDLDIGVSGDNAEYAALFFPRLKEFNPLRNNQIEEFVPCGAVAGLMARIDAQRGVWIADAGVQASLSGVQDFSVSLTDDENIELNSLGINFLRTFPADSRVIWGARTLAGDDRLASEYKYIPVRRLALFLEESLFRGTRYAVFEPNDERLYAQIRLNVGTFMQDLFRQGAFQGSSPLEAFLVKCEQETTTQSDVNCGIVNILVGFAPLKPAEFVIIKIQQQAGQLAA